MVATSVPLQMPPWPPKQPPKHARHGKPHLFPCVEARFFVLICQGAFPLLDWKLKCIWLAHVSWMRHVQYCKKQKVFTVKELAQVARTAMVLFSPLQISQT